MHKMMKFVVSLEIFDQLLKNFVEEVTQDTQMNQGFQGKPTPNSYDFLITITCEDHGDTYMMLRAIMDHSLVVLLAMRVVNPRCELDK